MIPGPITHRSESFPPRVLVRRSPEMLEGIIATGHTPPSVIAWLSWLRLRGLAPATTVAEYERVLTLLNAWLALRDHVHGAADDALIAATKQDLQAWRESLNGYAPGTVLAYAAPVRGFYAWLQEQDLRVDNPACGMPLPRMPRRLPRPIAEEVLEQAITGARPRVRVILVLAAYAGLRAIEIAGLRRQDILDTADIPILLITGKGSRQRAVPLGAHVWTELRLWGLPRRGFIIGREDGRPGPCKPQLISQIANDYLHESGIEETLHQFRHRFGTAAYGATHDLRLVQELMGHADPRTTSGYTAFSNTQAAAAVAAIEPRRRLRGLPDGRSNA